MHIIKHIKKSGLEIILIVVFIFLAKVAETQYRYDWKSHIDYLVEKTDSISMKSQKTFYLPKIRRVGKNFVNDQTIKETWNYTEDKGNVIIFQIRYVIDHREYTEVYYLNHERLICMENYETPYLATYIDEVRKGEIFFVVDNAIRTAIRFGNRKTVEPSPLWDAQYDCVTMFEKRFAELKRYMR